MGKSSKRTRNFVKKQLGPALAIRRKLKPMKTALRRKQDAAVGKRAERSSSLQGGGTVLKNKRVEDMDVDELLQGDYLDSVGDEEDEDVQEGDSDGLSPEKGDDDDFVDITPQDVEDESSEEEEADGVGNQTKKLKSEITKHKNELEKLKLKDPEFYKFLQEHDEDLLEFDDDEEMEDIVEGDDTEHDQPTKKGKATTKIEGQRPLSSALTDAWSKAIMEKQHVGAVRNMLRAYRSACHYGDGEGDDLASKFNIGSSHVFNKIMLFVLREMDSVFRKMLGQDDEAETKQGKQIGVGDFQKSTRWKKVEPLVRSYLSNSHHILKQMSDNEMIGFTLRRIKASVPFLAAFPKLARIYLKVALHFWGSGEGALPVISLLFIREMALQLGTDYLDACLKGIYKEYAANCRFVNPTRLPQIRFMANCVIELYGIDLAASYQHAFVFIRQLAMLLRNALTMKTKESFKSVYRWQFMNCLELWVNLLCAYSSKEDLRPLVYPLVQIIMGVARLVPTVRYFPLRLYCAKLLNRLSASSGSYIPVCALLMDILQFKELHVPPTGGAGKAFDFSMALKVPKPMLKTRAFHEECVSSVIDQLAEHLSQWSCSVAFPELAVVPLTHLGKFLKLMNADRFHRQIKLLIEQIKRNVEFVTNHRDKVTFSPKDTQAVNAFLQDEKKAGASPLLQYVAQLRQSAEDRQKNLQSSSMLVGDATPQTAINDEDDEEDELGDEVFSKDWLPPKKVIEVKAPRKSPTQANSRADGDEDIVEDLDLSSEDDEDDVDVVTAGHASSSFEGKSAEEKQSKKQSRSKENGHRKDRHGSKNGSKTNDAQRGGQKKHNGPKQTKVNGSTNPLVKRHRCGPRPLV